MRFIRIASLLIATCLGISCAWAVTEPTIDQVYQATNSGRVREAREMIDQVLQAHPKSAKAHFVKAEIAARESNAGLARQELAEAERLAPGLPFCQSGGCSVLAPRIG